MQTQAQFAADLIALEEELKYAEAFAADDPAAAANLARANAELNAAFATYNQASEAKGRGISDSDANAIIARLTIVREILTNPTAPVTGTMVSTPPAVLVNTQLSPTIGNGSKLFEIGMWVLGIVPGIVLQVKKNKARNYFTALDRRINSNAAQIDVFLEQRAQILRNCPGFTADIDPGLASGLSTEARNITNGRIDHAYQVLVENARAANNGVIPPELERALRADRNVQREITAARTLYNDTVNMWNTDIFMWPAKQMVAADERLTTRPVFVGSRLGATLDLNRGR